MLFSVSYHSKHKTIADEIRCPYNQLGYLYKFMQEHPEKRYNIFLPEDTEDLSKLIEQVNLVKQVTENYTIQCRKVTHLRALRESGYVAYLGFPVVDWETFYYLRRLEVSDIYIDGSLGFQMDKIAAAKGDIKIRISPTVSPNTVLAANRPITSFYIRPEDLPTYVAIDVIDFQDPDKEDVLFSIYHRGNFTYNLNELIPSLPAVNNTLFRNDFAEQRANCGQICMQPNKSCHYCSRYYSILEKMIKVAEYHKKS